MASEKIAAEAVTDAAASLAAARRACEPMLKTTAALELCSGKNDLLGLGSITPLQERAKRRILKQSLMEF
jgi:hypothetical protein